MLRPERCEDFIEYRIFVKDPSSLEACVSDCTQWIFNTFPFLQSFIWQRDSFNLSVDKSGKIPCLFGNVVFGDNLEEEWFITFLLFELSRAKPDLVIAVSDFSGEHILIEAVDFLPKWLEPSTSKNRVFVYRGEVHIIPFPCDGKESAPFARASVGLREAVQLIWQYGPQKLTLASVALNKCIEKKLSCFPHDALIKNFHHCHLVVPKMLAAVLEKEPSILAKAVEAFYYRTTDDMKAVQLMKKFHPDKMSVSRVRIRFTRNLFSMLSQQSFHVPHRSFPALPLEGSPMHKAQNLGMRLWCGFEMLHAQGCKELDTLLSVLGDGAVPVDTIEKDGEDDSEDWMQVSPEEVDEMFKESSVSQEDVDSFQSHLNELFSFMGHESSLDGAEVPQAMDDKLFEVKRFLDAMQDGLDVQLAQQVDEEQEVVDEEMERELQHFGMDNDFEKDDDGEVNVDLNLVKNIIEGMSASNGQPGPMKNLMEQLSEMQKRK